MAKTLKSDRILFLTTILLVCTSLVMVYSASAAKGLDEHGDPKHFAVRQAMWIALGLGLSVLTTKLNYRSYRNDAVVWTLLGGVGLLLLAVPFFGVEINGARRWLSFDKFSLQPSELAKLACVLFTALMLERRSDRIHEVKGAIMPIGLVVAMLVGLIMTGPDLGTSLSIVGIVTLMLFGAGMRYAHLAIGVASVSVFTLLVAWSYPYMWERLAAFWNPTADLGDSGFQRIQSLMAVGAGGVTGMGFMAGQQKLGWLPEAHNDFVYAVIGEEFGLIGATVVLGCFVLVAWRGLHIASRAEDMFGAFIALGITAMIAVQGFVNMSVVLGLLPTKGIPLPLVSAGGSSMVVSLLGMGVLLNISRHAVPGR